MSENAVNEKIAKERIWPPAAMQSFKEVMARWSSGVTIVTTRQATLPVGMTASSFTSVTLSPPKILICVDHGANTYAAITRSRYFAVNLLGIEQLEWAKRFAGLQPAVTDRFAGIAWTTAETGSPILPGVLGWLDCYLSQEYASGDHTIFIGDVVACSAAYDLVDTIAPLLYFRRAWRQLAG